jgi:mRNA-degrading endonuclease HigB of HigAB toxin-antitoxin module
VIFDITRNPYRLITVIHYAKITKCRLKDMSTSHH